MTRVIQRVMWLAYGAMLLGAIAVTDRDAAALQGGPATAAVAIDSDDIGGTVRGPNGPEAGVWVIAETTDLPTRLRKIVVTDDQGRYVIPDLPKANYTVWVRGYGLVDSPKVRSAPGNRVALTAVPAPDGKAAAHYYPPNYWLSLLQVPPPTAFPMPIPAAQGTTGRGGLPPQPGQIANQG